MENQKIKLQESQIVKLLGEYFILKAKTFSQNSVYDKRKAAIFLSMQHDFKSFKSLSVFISKAVKLGIISAGGLSHSLKCVEHFVMRDGYFEPNMTEQKYIDYFFNLTKTLKASTIMVKYRSINLFLFFLMSKGIPAKNIKNIKLNFLKDNKLPSFLNDLQYKRFLKEVHHLNENTLRQKRDKLALLIVSYTGIRSRELSHISFDDIDEDGEQYLIKIKGKCAKERFVSIRKDLIGALFENFKTIKKQQGLNSPYLLNISLKNSQKPAHIRIDVKSILKRLECVQPQGNHLHLLRHSFASFVYRETKDLLLTQNALGHSSINNTQIYVHMNQDTHKRVSCLF
ncbi:site-specific integrase [Helicobacter sp. MIT 21-1697]|uniref:tyrosine-type recombinase/integrase n=1 Tax=Helicobacter sp. MIT 21-1697 TaxID=2993733 RepID=UPI00224A985C|nr:site-specific integrase [Helicobacter sp. MIT 21-1697]MCX2716817.1 site-specific integrase [Helicobacter sp. MIT 21-1697]